MKKKAIIVSLIIILSLILASAFIIQRGALDNLISGKVITSSALMEDDSNNWSLDSINLIVIFAIIFILAILTLYLNFKNIK